jgi:2-polyprenyl-3-methyl-5-hydroxy-6-metoxy-1,4-benzoquinol methylase
MDRTMRRHITGLYDHRLQRLYVRAKLTGDPVYAAAFAIIADSALPLLDIGCGIGLLGQCLNARGHTQPYLGLDHDNRKIDTGRRAAQQAGLDAVMRLQHVDAAELPAMQGHVALLDVLHYLSADRQLALLRAATLRLAPQGCLIIRNVLREPNWRFLATRVEEFFLHASGWLPDRAQHYPSAGELLVPLEGAGLEVSIEPLRGHSPFNSYLIVARRPG